MAAARRPSTGDWSRACARATARRVLLRLADLIRPNLEELALLEFVDMGKLVTDAATVDVPAAARCRAVVR